MMSIQDLKKQFFIQATGSSSKALPALEYAYYLAGVNGSLPSSPVSYTDLTDVPARLTAAQAAGTASIRAIGVTATTAKAGNWFPTWGEVTGKPTTFPPTDIVAGADGLAAGTVQATVQALATRIAALETPA